MALLHADSFDGWQSANDNLSRYASASATTVTGGRNSGRALNVGGGILNVQMDVSASGTYYMSCWYNFSATPPTNNMGLLVFMEGTTAHITIGISTAGNLVAWRGTGTGTSLGTASPGSTSSWHFLLAAVTIADAGGTVKVYLDGLDAGSKVIDFTGDTRNAGTSGIFSRAQCGSNANSGAITAIVDDWVVWDSSGSGLTGIGTHKQRVTNVVPNADGSHTDSTIGGTSPAATRWQGINAYQGSASWSNDYNVFDTLDDTDTYQFSDLTLDSINGVVVLPMVALSAAGTCAGKILARSSGGTEVESGALSVASTNYRVFEYVMTTDATGAAWTVANFNAHQFGWHRTQATGTPDTRLTFYSVDVVQDDDAAAYSAAGGVAFCTIVGW